MRHALVFAALAFLLPLSAQAANVDVGLTGTPAAVTAALAAHGFQLNPDGTTSLIDPTLNAAGLTVTGYRVLDGVAYVLVRTPAGIAVPAGLTVVGAQQTAAISGVFLWDTPPPPPAVISVNAFFARFTQAERTALLAALPTHAAWGVPLVNAALSPGVDLTLPATATMVNALVTGGVLTSARAAVILTP
jgi:hypothetical protein